MVKTFSSQGANLDQGFSDQLSRNDELSAGLSKSSRTISKKPKSNRKSSIEEIEESDEQLDEELE
jgi:DNA repair exonuclease SbcCD ATPase subunit